MRDYPSNSMKSKQEKQNETTERRVNKVVSGKASTKVNEGRRLANIFISDEAANVKSYVFMDVLVPAIKKAISDIVVNGIDMILYGKTGGSNNRQSSKISYRQYYNDKNDDRFGSSRAYATGNKFDYDDIVFASRIDADDVLKEMRHAIEIYGFVTLGDMYDMADLPAPYTSRNFGWTSLRNAEVIHVRNGYIIKLPKAYAID